MTYPSGFGLCGSGLPIEVGAHEVGTGGFSVPDRGRGGHCGIKSVEDEEIALGIVERRESRDALEVVLGSKGIHFFVFNLVPGDVPAGVVGLNSDRKIHGAEVVADGGQAGHEGELRAADGEDERIVGWVGGDDAMDLVGGVGEGVVGSADIVESLASVGDGEYGQDRHCDGDDETVQAGLGGCAGTWI